MNEQAGLIYWINPIYVKTPTTDEGLRIYRSDVDDLYYVKKSDGTSELFTVGLGPISGGSQFRGAWDASLNTFPATGGSGPAGAILAGDSWVITVGGVLCGEDVVQGDLIIALVDAPAQVCANWTVIENNIGYVPENVANKATDFTVINDILYPSVEAVEERIDFKLTGPQGEVVFYGATGIESDPDFVFDDATTTLKLGVNNIGEAILDINGGNGFGSTFSVRQRNNQVGDAGSVIDVLNQDETRAFILGSQTGTGAGTTAKTEIMFHFGGVSTITAYDVDGVPRASFGQHSINDPYLINSREDIATVGSDGFLGWTDTLSSVMIDSIKGLGFSNPYFELITNQGAGVTGNVRILGEGASYFTGDTNQLGLGIQVPTARLHIKGFTGDYALKVESFAGARLFDITDAGVISMPTVQVGDAGLVAGDLYFDTAVNILANGDLIAARVV